MKTLERRKLSPHKVAHIQINRYGEYYVAIEQTYDEGKDYQDTQVLEAKTYKTLSGVNKFIQYWTT